MQNTSFSLIALSITACLAGTALAQGDECTGAIAVVFGANGPYTNVGATNSVPAFPCATGGADVWFSYIPPGTGSLTADTCGASYDSMIEIFDGTAGCGGLVSMACNDDFCGLSSSVTVAVTVGTPYFIRVGGWGATPNTGTFTLNINGPTGGATVAAKTPFGTGCVGKYTSFYEHFPTTPSFDLSNTAFQMLHTGTAYIVLSSAATFVPPTGGATTLALGDDSQTTVTLSAAMPYPGGTTPTLQVCSNGFISTASNGTSYQPNPTTFLGWANTAWAVWRDFYPTIGNPATGTITFEEVGGIAYISWNAVVGYVGTAQGTTPSTFQFQFDVATGNVTVVFLTMDTISVNGWGGGEGWVVGYSPGGPSLNPGNKDLSAPGTLPITLEPADVGPPLALDASQRPIQGTTINLNTSNIPAGSPFGAVILGFVNPAINLTGIGMAGCTQYTDSLASILFIAPGATNSTPFTVPAMVGVTIKAQAAVYCPAAGLTLLGAIASQGLDLFIGSI